MGKRVVKVSSELLTEMITEGWQAGGDDEIVRCIKGLPSDATFVGSEALEWS